MTPPPPAPEPAPESATPRPKGSLRRRSLEGVLWTVMSTGGGQVLRFASNLILTRLLIPEYFAVMAIVNTVIAGLDMFSDVGIRPSVIQSDRGEDPDFLNTAWTFQVIRGVVLWVLTILLAWPVAVFYEAPMLASLLPVAGLTALIRGFRSTSFATLNRRLQIRPIVLLTFMAQLGGMVVAVVWAYFAPSPWALVASAIFATAFATLLSHRLDPTNKPRFLLEPAARRELIAFGRWVFLSTAMTFLSGRSDRLILGKLFPLALFGVFSIAANIAQIPQELLIRVSAMVLLPAVAEMKKRPRPELRRAILRVRLLPSLGMAVVLAFGITVADFAVRLLYEENYWDAAWMLPTLVAGTVLSVLTNTAAPALLSLGKPKYGAASSTARFVYLAVGLPAGFQVAGPAGSVTVLAFAELPRWIVSTIGLRREGLSVLRQDLLILAVFGGALAALLALRQAIGFGSPWGG